MNDISNKLRILDIHNESYVNMENSLQAQANLLAQDFADEITPEEITIADELMTIVNEDNDKWMSDDKIDIHVNAWLKKCNYNPERLFQVALSQGHRLEYTISLGFLYRWGIGTEKNDVEAFSWYKVAADAGLSLGISEIGYCYQNSLGVEQSDEKALECYMKSAEMGNAFAQCSLATCYSLGVATAVDYEKALIWYTRSAVAGNSIAQHDLAYSYYCGLGTRKDYRTAFYWYLESAMKGLAAGCYKVGTLLKKGHGTNIDLHEALWWFRRGHNFTEFESSESETRCYYSLRIIFTYGNGA
ncbi:hypothetical protein G9A89_003488 [Geosiphon pyriformis]|nr:hypothetical protein G9A89_003488 [Geosiphon pyriformis]